jgi:hypothetical protein
MTPFDPAAYGPAIEKLLRPHRLPALAVDPPYRAMHAQLEAFEDDAAFAPFAIRDRAMASACRAGLWLFFDFLDEAHTISQNLHTPESSYWHALVHRREPDHSNAAYWFRRVGTHPVFEPLRVAAANLAASAPPQAEFLSRQQHWDPFAFNDLCEVSDADTAPCNELCRRVQRVEWELLFDYCHRAMRGTEG